MTATSETNTAGTSTSGLPAEGAPVEGTRYAPTLNPDYPSSWWIVGHSRDIARGRSAPLRVLENDLVLWRGRDGVLHSQAAHCLHLGAHLGYGGAVTNDTLQCPFHGWCYDENGAVTAQVGPPRPVQKLQLPTYRIAERHGVVFLWNGGGTPDHDIPDFYEFYGVSPKDYFVVDLRFYMPFPAKYFNENICDSMHFAVAHGAAEWGETVVVNQTETSLQLENRLHNPRPWFTLQNIKRLYLRGEIVNLFTPVRGSLLATSYGGTVNMARIEGVEKWGNQVVGWTPIDSDTHYFNAISVVPRPRVPLIEPILRKIIGLAIRVGVYSTATQDAALLRHRQERPKPPYAKFDKGLIAFRRFWDSRIESDHKFTGDGVRSNGAHAGVHAGLREVRK